MSTSAGCDENMNDDEEERRENEGVHGRVVDDERVERAEGGLEEADTHVEEENEKAYETPTPTAVRGGVGGFPFGAAGWTPPTGSDSSTPGSPGYDALHRYADELFRLWPTLYSDPERREASFRELGKFFEEFVQSDERTKYNLTFMDLLAAFNENPAREELIRTPSTG